MLFMQLTLRILKWLLPVLKLPFVATLLQSLDHNDSLRLATNARSVKLGRSVRPT